MNTTDILNLLHNSGLTDAKIEGDFVVFTDPTCIFPAFDTLLEYAWIVIMTLTGVMLFGWAVLYIKNGVKIDTLFNNAKALILILCTLSLVKPIVDFVYGDNLFARQCETKKVSLASVNELLNMRKKYFSKSDQAMLYETFTVVDSGPINSQKTESVSVDDNE